MIRISALLILLLSITLYLYKLYKNSIYSLPMDKVYVINLDRSPERLAAMTRELSRLQIPFTRFKAIDYKDITVINRETKQVVKNEYFINDNEFFSHQPGTYEVFHKDFPEIAFIFDNSSPIDASTRKRFNYIDLHRAQIFLPGELGCACSHLAVLNDIVHNNYIAALIFEDDVIFNSDFKEQLICLLHDIPKDADLIYFGYGRIKEKLRTKIVPVDENFYLPKSIVTQTYAYYVTNKGAKKILENSKIIKYAIDIHISNLSVVKNLKIYIVREKKLRSALKNEVSSTINKNT